MNAILDGPRDALAAALADAKDRLLHSSSLKDGVLEKPRRCTTPDDVSPKSPARCGFRC